MLTHTHTQIHSAGLWVRFILCHAQTPRVLPQALSDSRHWSPWSSLPHSTLLGIIHVSLLLWPLHCLSRCLLNCCSFAHSCSLFHICPSHQQNQSSSGLTNTQGDWGLAYDGITLAPVPVSSQTLPFNISYLLGKFCDCTVFTLSDTISFQIDSYINTCHSTQKSFCGSFPL